MLWCLASGAVVLLLLGLAALKVHPGRLLTILRPGLLLRGCLAMLCLLMALGLAGLALLAVR